ncbi:MAG: hypothetical protein QF479_03455 [Candidatus Poseidoniaceae archaeon]|jgi:hypothetical protein|nr:hypothetical protein [Candidatus Poseidoniaceae archaeon]HJM87318.1 hypothetical protein [Candidatus Thalassarchaeaceae archaeon]
MRFLEPEDPIALAALQYLLERDAKDVKKLLEWLPQARTKRDRLAILDRANSLMQELEHAINRIAEVE